MAYERQVQIALDRFDQSLAQLRGLIKRGDNADAIRFMEEGPLKDRFEELQNIINVSKSNNYGSRGVPNTRPL